MDILQQHEQFEVEVLDHLKSGRFLEPLVFGGGTMLRLCHELNRYSVDLDFWFIKERAAKKYFATIKKSLAQAYEITDAHMKHFTILIEVRSSAYPKRLKIEIRRALENCACEERIAYSPASPRQVILRVMTLGETMRRKIAALPDRAEIRDAFDIEFLLRRGIPLPSLALGNRDALIKTVRSFKKRDFTVKLGSILNAEARAYYGAHGFEYLIGKLEVHGS